LPFGPEVAHVPRESKARMRHNFERRPTTPPGPSGIRPDALWFMIDKRNHPARLAVAGEIELATCGSLVDAVYDAMTLDVHALDIDVSGVTFRGSTGIPAFLMMRQRAQEEGRSALVGSGARMPAALTTAAATAT